MEDSTAADTIVIVLRADTAHLNRAPLDLDWVPPAIWVGAQRFKLCEGDPTDFYDWLRAPCGACIGVRIFPYQLLQEDLIEAIKKLPYCKPTPPGQVEIYFGGSRQLDDPNSGDQLIPRSYLWRSEDGTFALTFDWSEIDSLPLGVREIPIEQLLQQSSR